MNKIQKFDVSRKPPTQEQIDRGKEELERMEEKAQKTLYPMPLALFFVVTCIFFTLIFMASSQTHTHVVIPALVIAFAIAGAMQIISLMAAAKKQSDIKSAMQQFEPISPDHCTSMIHWCETYEEIRAYQNNVADMGRPLTEGEYQAILDWTKLSQGQAGHPSAYHRLLKRIQTAA